MAVKCPYWVLDERLGGCHLPSPQDLRRLARQGVTMIVSLVEDEEFDEDSGWPGGVREFLEEAGELGIRVVRLPTPDYSAPDPAGACRVFEEVKRELERGGRVVVHCKAGRGRTGTFLAAYLAWSQGLTPQEAVEAVKAAEDQAGPEGSEDQATFIRAVARGICNTLRG